MDLDSEPTGPLGEARLKLARAESHRDALYSEMLASAQNVDQFMTIRQELDHETSRFSLRVDSVKTLPADWSLILGDFLTNARAALDYTAWKLVLKGRTPSPAIPNKVQFVIEEATRHGFDSQAGDRLPGVRREHLAVVRSVQPYHLGDKSSQHPLALLRRFSNTDKHERLHLAMRCGHEEFRASIGDCRDFVVQSTELGSDLITCFESGFYVDAELIVVHGEVTGPDPHVNSHLGGNYVAVLEDGSERWMMPGLMGTIANAVRAVLDKVEPLL